MLCKVERVKSFSCLFILNLTCCITTGTEHNCGLPVWAIILVTFSLSACGVTGIIVVLFLRKRRTQSTRTPCPGEDVKAVMGAAEIGEFKARGDDLEGLKGEDKDDVPLMLKGP
jgi:hypothetical protein